MRNIEKLFGKRRTLLVQVTVHVIRECTLLDLITYKELAQFAHHRVSFKFHEHRRNRCLKICYINIIRAFVQRNQSNQQIKNEKAQVLHG